MCLNMCLFSKYLIFTKVLERGGFGTLKVGLRVLFGQWSKHMVLYLNGRRKVIVYSQFLCVIRLIRSSRKRISFSFYSFYFFFYLH